MDINHEWGNDLVASPTGDLSLVDGSPRGRQRVLRRLLTNQGEYVFHLTYGAGLPGRVGQLLSNSIILAIVRSQIFFEAAVARDPAPRVTLSPVFNGTNCRIVYTDKATGLQQSLSFDVGTP